MDIINEIIKEIKEYKSENGYLPNVIYLTDEMRDELLTNNTDDFKDEFGGFDVGKLVGEIVIDGPEQVLDDRLEDVDVEIGSDEFRVEYEEERES